MKRTEVMTGNTFAQKDEERAAAHLHARVTTARKNRYVRQAESEGLKLTEWMQKHLDAVCDTADGQDNGKPDNF